MARHFAFVEGRSSKFWEIDTRGCSVHVRYGRIGTAGQSLTKSFGSESAASQHAQRLITQKLAKGYQETIGS